LLLWVDWKREQGTTSRVHRWRDRAEGTKLDRGCLMEGGCAASAAESYFGQIWLSALTMDVRTVGLDVEGLTPGPNQCRYDSAGSAPTWIGLAAAASWGRSHGSRIRREAPIKLALDGAPDQSTKRISSQENGR